MLMHTTFNNLEYRRHQVDTLKVLNENVVETIELEEYCVHFKSAARNYFLTVSLTPNFPNEHPKLVVAPIILHPWVNSTTGEVHAAPGLFKHSPHSDLGSIVQAIIREFERFPPPLLTLNSSTYSSLASNVSGNNGVIATKPSDNIIKLNKSNIYNTAKGSISSPPSSDTIDDHCIVSEEIQLNYLYIPNLSSLSLDELKQLDNDPEFFDDFIEEMSVVHHLNEELDSMINQVEIIARKNERKEFHLMELKHKLSDDVATLKKLGEKCDQLNKKYFKKSEDYDPQHIRELLQIAASNIDTECDGHVEQFLNGNIDVQTFLQNYIHSKKLSSERKAKEERLGQQFIALERSGF